MSLDCYPLVRGRSIGLEEQPMALDVAYDQNLLVTVIESCQKVIVYELQDGQDECNNVLGSFTLGHGVVVNSVVYSELGDYIACIGHNNGSIGVRVVFGWRSTASDDARESETKLRIEELELSQTTTPIDEIDRQNRLESIDICQRTGNLAASYGDLVVIYQYNRKGKQDEDASRAERKANRRDEDASSQHSSDDLDKLNELTRPPKEFNHIISVKLSIWVHSISLVENYLSLTTSDHVQVIKMELLTLQIQSDGQNDNEQLSNFQTNQTNRSSSGSSGDSRQVAPKLRRSSAAAAVANRNRRTLMGSAGEGTNAASTTTASSDGDTDSLMSDSNNSTTTNFSAFTTTTTTTQTATSATMPAQLTASDCSDAEPPDGCDEQSVSQTNNDSDMSIITMNQQIASLLAPPDESAGQARANSNCHDDCITWNLNTKKLVKLPTLMHNTSSDLSSFHICHPLELLGPASESIACRVTARLYAPDFCQNQLEPVVLLCKQFDCDRDPVKSTHLQPVYLSTLDDQKRLSRSMFGAEPTHSASSSEPNGSASSDNHLLLKSQDHQLLASVTCFVATLTNCFVYSLHGKKVTRIQTITHPAMCLDLRPDLLNVYVLTTPGLQICSTGLCDSTFRYDWSSSADLNLSFVACDRARVLATSKYLVMVASAPRASRTDKTEGTQESCFIEVLLKPDLRKLIKRVVHINQRCQSISIRSNLLTYLHASAQLSLIGNRVANKLSTTSQQGTDNSIETLKSIAIMLCKELLLKKQTNVITNSRIDKVIKHLLDISHCDLNELMSRHMEKLTTGEDSTGAMLQTVMRRSYSGSVNDPSYSEDEVETEDEQPQDSDYELLTIYLRYAKFQPFILAYLQANACNEIIATRLTTYMFDHNPRLLIKCTQRFAKDNCQLKEQKFCLNLLIERLKQLAEFDSTGINRATVLFTLANLYSAMDEHRELAVQTLSQIKPLSHLAITMCSNHEIIDRPMAELVSKSYPEAYKLFLTQLGKRDTSAACEFAKLFSGSQKSSEADQQVSNRDDLAIKNFGAKLKVFSSNTHDNESQDSQEQDEEELFDQKLEFLASIEPGELADLFLQQKASSKQLNENSNQSECEQDETIEAYLRASIGLLETQFILTRLCESSR